VVLPTWVIEDGMVEIFVGPPRQAADFQLRRRRDMNAPAEQREGIDLT